MYTTVPHLVASTIVMAAWFAGSLQQPLPHSTHNSKHGGQFFPVAADTLHVEGVWAQQRVFKLYVYDESSRPLPAERMGAIQGRVRAAGEEAPLLLLSDASAFQARVPLLRMPAEISLEIRLSAGAEPALINFSFPAYTDEGALSFDAEPAIIPDTARGIVLALRGDVREAESLIERMQTAYVFAAAVHARDHALALERFLPQVADPTRPRAEATIRTAVRTAWLLHIASDDGTHPQIVAATAALRAAVDELADAFAGIAR